jgi:hypothetical protein
VQVLHTQYLAQRLAHRITLRFLWLREQ